MTSDLGIYQSTLYQMWPYLQQKFSFLQLENEMIIGICHASLRWCKQQFYSVRTVIKDSLSVYAIAFPQSYHSDDCNEKYVSLSLVIDTNHCSGSLFSSLRCYCHIGDSLIHWQHLLNCNRTGTKFWTRVCDSYYLILIITWALDHTMFNK